MLSHYDLGVVDSVTRFRGGSRQSPKVLITSDRGQFILKRREPPAPVALPVSIPASVPSRADAFVERLAYTHEVMSALARTSFPLPELILTRRDSTSLLRLVSGVYEMFRFVAGERYDRREDSAFQAGGLLALMHTNTAELQPTRTPPAGTYHNRPGFSERLTAITTRIDDARAGTICRSLGELYARAAHEGELCGVSAQPTRVLHADWHPGNMIFHPRGDPSTSGARIASVVDFDSCRRGPLVVDVANGALQFAALRRIDATRSPENGHKGEASAGSLQDLSQTGAGMDPLDLSDHHSQPGEIDPERASVEVDPIDHEPRAAPWRIVLDPSLLSAFCAGYRARDPLGVLASPEMLRAIPWLMAEAIISEAVLPIAATGEFGRLDPLGVLALVERTASSIVAEHARLVSMVEGTYH